jgi:hypothetical protein
LGRLGQREDARSDHNNRRNRRVIAPRRWNWSLYPHQGAFLPASFIAYDVPATRDGTGRGDDRPISDKISANICRDTETSVNSKVRYRPD